MRSLIITPIYPPAVGGAATYFGEIAVALAVRSEIDRLVLLTEQTPGWPKRQEQGKLTVLRLLPRRVSVAQRPYPLHVASYFQTQGWFARHLSALTESEAIDLIHYHTRYGGGLFYRSLHGAKQPVIADMRDKFTDPSELVAVADRLLCCSEGVLQYVESSGFPPAKTRLIPLSFTPPAIPSSEQIEDVRRHFELEANPFLLYLGNINATRGVFELLTAFAQWREKHPQVQLLLAGGNYLGDDLLKRVSSTPGVRYLGSVPHEQALILVAAADIVLLPSQSEGLPRVMLEALALGRRVLAPPGVPEFERHLPEFVLPRVDADNILSALERVWRTETLPTYPFAEHRVSIVVDKLIETYTELT